MDDLQEARCLVVAVREAPTEEQRHQKRDDDEGIEDVPEVGEVGRGGAFLPVLVDLHHTEAETPEEEEHLHDGEAPPVGEAVEDGVGVEGDEGAPRDPVRAALDVGDGHELPHGDVPLPGVEQEPEQVPRLQVLDAQLRLSEAEWQRRSPVVVHGQPVECRGHKLLAAKVVRQPEAVVAVVAVRLLKEVFYPLPRCRQLLEQQHCQPLEAVCDAVKVRPGHRVAVRRRAEPADTPLPAGGRGHEACVGRVLHVHPDGLEHGGGRVLLDAPQQQALQGPRDLAAAQPVPVDPAERLLRDLEGVHLLQVVLQEPGDKGAGALRHLALAALGTAALPDTG
mmetsp:Transcript_89496/g.283266  ORF Transcript_89496/g.283266 Transcript_89496/m.283266 type:complete len:337 (-) Transcript_89496:469-1479(-)